MTRLTDLFAKLNK